MVRSADCKAFLGEVRGAAQVLDLVLSLENCHQEVAFLDVVDIQTVHPGVVAAFGQQRDAVIERQIEGRGHAQNNERRGFALVLVRPREPFRVGFDDARDPEIDDAGVDVRSLAPMQPNPGVGEASRRTGHYHRLLLIVTLGPAADIGTRAEALVTVPGAVIAQMTLIHGCGSVVMVSLIQAQYSS